MGSKATLSDRLKFYRKAAKLTQQQVADALGVQRSAYAYYEINKTTPKLATLSKLAKLYNVSVDQLINEEDYNTLMTERAEYEQEVTKGENLFDDKFNDLSPLEKSVVLKLRIMSAEQRRNVVDTLF
ncbi:MAG: helix-turn-helix transcriptional regulator [Eubacteriales bacterium]|nr:helix-turn-helix transcriptional regulator [Eubacteriales bacterium]